MDDRVLGAGILLGSLIGLGLYFYLVFLSPWIVLIVQISAFVAVAAVLLIVAWIGYTLATTPPPTSLEDLDIKEDTEEVSKEGETETTKEEKP
jgi:predicted DNA-binding transcriptional regulator